VQKCHSSEQNNPKDCSNEICKYDATQDGEGRNRRALQALEELDLAVGDNALRHIKYGCSGDDENHQGWHHIVDDVPGGLSRDENLHYHEEHKDWKNDGKKQRYRLAPEQPQLG